MRNIKDKKVIVAPRRNCGQGNHRLKNREMD